MTPPVAILAGGLATRLGTLTAQTPKSLLPVAGLPFIDHQLRHLKSNRVDRVVLLVGHQGERIEAHVGSGERFGLQVAYAFDGPTRLGTGGAIKQALSLLGPEFFVLYGDSYLPLEYAPVLDAFRGSGHDGLMTVFHNEDSWDRSNVQFEDGQIVRYDKTDRTPRMKHIDYGLGILTPRAFEPFPGGLSFDLSDVYQGLIARGSLAGFSVADRFYEIGSVQGLNELNELLSREQR